MVTPLEGIDENKKQKCDSCSCLNQMAPRLLLAKLIVSAEAGQTIALSDDEAIQTTFLSLIVALRPSIPEHVNVH